MIIICFQIHKIRIKDASGKDIRLGDGIPKPKWLVKHDAISYDNNKVHIIQLISIKAFRDICSQYYYLNLIKSPTIYFQN